jgi:hypothetical protein
LCPTPRCRDAPWKRPVWSERHRDARDPPVERRAIGAVPAVAGEDRQVAALTIFKSEKGRNHAKNAKIVKIVNFYI